MKTLTLHPSPEDNGMRLDAFVAGLVPELSRNAAADLIKSGKIMVDERSAKPALRVTAGQTVTVSLPAPRPVEIVAQDIPVRVVFEDADLLVVDKPQGMVVHPARGNWEGTLVNALLHQVQDLSGINGELRPGIVHRLDKDTSGLMIVAKNDFAHRRLAAQIKEHQVLREYTALVHGCLEHSAGRIEVPIGRSPRDRKKMAAVPGGRPSATNFTVMERFRDFTLVRCRLETGRTHQIRVHMAYLGHPVAGDPVYGPRKGRLELPGQALHAGRLEFAHPRSGEKIAVSSPLPSYFSGLLEELRKREI